MKSVRNSETPALALLPSKDTIATALVPYCNGPNNTMLTYKLKPELFIKLFLSDLGDALNGLSTSSTKTYYNLQTVYSPNPEMKWKYYTILSGTENIKASDHSEEDMESEEIYKTLFYIELKMIHDVNFEKDDNKVYSDIYYYDNKEGGIIDGRL